MPRDRHAAERRVGRIGRPSLVQRIASAASKAIDSSGSAVETRGEWVPLLDAPDRS